jgi:hypothetical protein
MIVFVRRRSYPWVEEVRYAWKTCLKGLEDSGWNHLSAHGVLNTMALFTYCGNQENPTVIAKHV